MKAKTLLSLFIAVSTSANAAKFDFPLHDAVVTVESPYDNETHYLLVGDPIDKALALLGAPCKTFVVEDSDTNEKFYVHNFNHRGLTFQVIVAGGTNKIISIDPVF
jgi:hypothetical protein